MTREDEEIIPLTNTTEEDRLKFLRKELQTMQRLTDMPIITDWLYSNNVSESFASFPYRPHISTPHCDE